MKKITLCLCVLLFTACNGAAGPKIQDNREFYKLDIGESSYYFQYPSSAVVADGKIKYGGCDIKFGQKISDLSYLGKDVKNEKKQMNNRFLDAYFKNNNLVAYRGVVEKPGFEFLVLENVTDCSQIVDDITASFSDSLDYINEKYGFGFKLKPDFKVEYLGDDHGVLMKKWVEKDAYKVEIVMIARENIEGYKDLSEFVAKKYDGYSVEFSTFDNLTGVFVNESSGSDAIRHFFALNDGKIYEIYLKLPAVYYSRHKDGFEEVVKTVKIF